MANALDRFHANKSIFVDLGVHTDFNLPKLHSCKHYIMYIELLGTTDNYNTEYTERLHNDLAISVNQSQRRVPPNDLVAGTKGENLSPQEVYSVALGWLSASTYDGSVAPGNRI